MGSIGAKKLTVVAAAISGLLAVVFLFVHGAVALALVFAALALLLWWYEESAS